MPSILLEICVDSLADARIAAEHGADRLELNAALESGGLTPTPGLVTSVRQALIDDGPGIPLIAMLRPRAGDFVYRSDEHEVMQADLERLLEMGVDGVALGVLTAQGTVNVARCRDLLRRMPGAEAVFHRAFDFVADPARALEQLIDLGFRRVLTSGQAASAIEGAALIARLIEQSRGRIEILPGAGVRAGNVAQLVERTGCDQVHGSMRRASPSTTGAHAATSIAFQMGETRGLDGDELRAVVAALRELRRQ